MKKGILILLVISVTGCLKSQVTGSLGREVQLTVPALFNFFGESNAPGQAFSTDLTTFEKSVRSNLQILYDTTRTFQPLHIGFNNLYSNADAADSLRNGMENGLACETDSGRLKSVTYLVKTGISGARVRWYYDSTYNYTTGLNAWRQFTRRTDTAMTLVTNMNGGVVPVMNLVCFLGLNDAATGSGTTHFKDSLESVFSRIRTRYQKARVVIWMMKLPIDSATATNPTIASRILYNSYIDEMANEVSEFYVIEVSGAALKNENHWNNPGFKFLAKRLIETLRAHYKY